MSDTESHHTSEAAEAAPAAAAAAAAPIVPTPAGIAEDALVVVTGASGFIAAHIVEQLLTTTKYRVRGTVRDPSNDQKTAHLRAMDPNGSRLELVKGNLLDEDVWDSVVAGATFVLHTASPFAMEVRDAVKDLVEPALHGTRYVLNACAGHLDTVRCVVVTSSVAALTDTGIKGHVFTEKDWNNFSNLKRNPYYYSKMLAEKEAWKYVEQKKLGDSCKLVTVSPFLVLGPSHTKSVGPSNAVVEGMLTGQYPVIADLDWGCVDVRDVAAAHLLVMQHPDAEGRHVCAADHIHCRDMATLLIKEFAGDHPRSPYKIPTTALDGAVGTGIMKLASYFQPGQVGQYLRTNLAKPIRFDNSKLKSYGFQFRPMNQTIIDTALDLMRWGHVPYPVAGPHAKAKADK